MQNTANNYLLISSFILYELHFNLPYLPNNILYDIVFNCKDALVFCKKINYLNMSLQKKLTNVA